MCSSAALGATSQIMQGMSDNNTAKANAKMAEHEAKSALNAANYKVQQIGKAGERIQGSTAVAQADAGVDLSSGSAAEVAAESARNIKLDQLMARFGGEQEAWAKRAQAKIYKAQGKAALVNGYLGAGSTILGAAKKAAMGGMG